MSLAMGDRPLESLQLSPSQRSRLTREGFRTVGEVLELSASDLAKELAILPAQAAELRATVRAAAGPTVNCSPPP